MYLPVQISYEFQDDIELGTVMWAFITNLICLFGKIKEYINKYNKILVNILLYFCYWFTSDSYFVNLIYKNVIIILNHLNLLINTVKFMKKYHKKEHTIYNVVI
jgi:hypothetical protein